MMQENRDNPALREKMYARLYPNLVLADNEETFLQNILQEVGEE
jgi:hypothetical protein